MHDYLSSSEGTGISTQTSTIPVSPTVPPDLQAQLREKVDAQISAPSLAQLLTGIWICGIILTAGWFLTTNLLFLRRAKKGATPYSGIISPVPIRISPNVSSPCLAGLFRPLIYLTPESTADPQVQDHIFTHELMHLKHADQIWAWVRCLCLCIYWFHPLVWIAAIVSKQDCELACDESALIKLGEGQRIAYGKTLLDTVTHSSVRIFQTTTAMSESKKQLKERVNFIVRKPKNMLIAVVCLILAVTLTAALAFIGCKSESESVTITVPQETQPQEQSDPIMAQQEAPSKESLLVLVQQAADIAANEETIKLNAYPYLRDYFNIQNSALTHSPALTIGDDTIIIRPQCTTGDTDGIEVYIYAVFLDLLLDRYADDVTPIDIYYEETYEPHYITELFLYTGWQDAGYDSIKDYHAAIHSGALEFPADAFYIGLHSPSIRQHGNNQNLYTRSFPYAETTIPIIPMHKRTIAMDAIEDYLWYRVVGICCDYEYVHADLSQYLTEMQKEHYHNTQYKITCCKDAEQVRAHIDHRLSTAYQISGSPDAMLFTDASGNLYLIVTPTDYNGYQHCDVISQTDTSITARACHYNEDGCYSNEIFTLNSTENGYQITNIEEDNDYQCETEIVNQGPTYAVVKHGSFFFGYQLYNEQGDLIISENTDMYFPTVTQISEHVTEVRIGNGTGIAQCTYWDMQTLNRSDPYEYVIAVGNRKIAYLDGELDQRILKVCDIFDRSTAQSFSDLGLDADVIPIIEAAFSENDTQLTLTYWTDKDKNATVSLHIS